MPKQGSAESPDHYRVSPGHAAVRRPSAHRFEASHDDCNEQPKLDNTPRQSLRHIMVDYVQVVRVADRYFASWRPVGGVG